MAWWKFRSQADSHDDEDEVELPPSAKTVSNGHLATTGQLITAQHATTGQVATHPVLAAALSAGIKTASQFADLHATALAARADALEQAEAECIGAFTSDKAPEKMKQLANASYAEIKERTEIWADVRNEKFGFGKDGSAPARQTEAPKADAMQPALAASSVTLSYRDIYKNLNESEGVRK